MNLFGSHKNLLWYQNQKFNNETVYKTVNNVINTYT